MCFLLHGWSLSRCEGAKLVCVKHCVISTYSHGALAHQSRTIAIASDLRVDGAKSPECPQKEWVFGLSEIGARNRKSRQRFSIAPLNRNAALLCLVSKIAAISGVRDGHRNRKSQKSLRFRCAKLQGFQCTSTESKPSEKEEVTANGEREPQNVILLYIYIYIHIHIYSQDLCLSLSLSLSLSLFFSPPPAL